MINCKVSSGSSGDCGAIGKRCLMLGDGIIVELGSNISGSFGTDSVEGVAADEGNDGKGCCC